jgi:K+-transporting ATPase ATPase C chain
MKNTVVVALNMLLILTVLTGLLYPLAVTVVAVLVFPHRSQGSPVRVDGRIVGSELIGQQWNSDRYFWSRPSAVGSNPLPSGGSNLGPTSRVLRDSIIARRSGFIHWNGLPAETPVPSEMLCASGSGVDPHISPPAAYLQVDRILRARGWASARRASLLALVGESVEARQWGVLGEPRVNVLRLNMALDQLERSASPADVGAASND